MSRRPQRSTRTEPLFPYTTLVRSASQPRDFSMPAARSRPCGAGDDGTPRSGSEDLVPLGDAVGLGGQRGVGIALDLHRLDGVALLDGVDDLQAFEHLAKHGVLAVQPVGLDRKSTRLNSSH